MNDKRDKQHKCFAPILNSPCGVVYFVFICVCFCVQYDIHNVNTVIHKNKENDVYSNGKTPSYYY